MTMKRTTSRLIRLPQWQDDPETNLRTFDYARRTAIPTLEDYIIEPFSVSIKDAAFQQAVLIVGLDESRLLKASHSKTVELAGKRFVATCSKTSMPSNETVLVAMRNYLTTIIADNEQGILREGVHKVDGQAQVLLDYVFQEMLRRDAESRTSFNKTLLYAKEPAEEKTATLGTPEDLLVYLNLERCKDPNPENARAYLAALSLGKAERQFIDRYEEEIRTQHGIPESDLSENKEWNYDLSDGSGVRYLFFPRKTFEYGKVLAGAFGEIVEDEEHPGMRKVGKKTKGVAGSTGDLVIVQELAFAPKFENARAGAGIRVSNEEQAGKRGRIAIQRFSKDGKEDTRTYAISKDEDRIYVAARDILTTLDLVQRLQTSVPTQIKIDLFAAPPGYLRNV